MKKSKSRFKWKPSAEGLKKRQGGNSTREGFLKKGVQIFKPSQGDNVLRILPPTWENAEHYGFDVWVHYEVGPDKATYACRQKMKGKNCPICEEAARATAKDDTEYAASLRPKRRVLVYLVDRDKEDEGVKVYPMSPNMDEDFAKLAVDNRTGELFNIVDQKEGYDIEFHRAGTTRTNTKYSGHKIARRPSKLGNSEWLEFAEEHPLPSLVKFPTYDEVAEAFAGGGSDDDDDGDEDEEERPSRKRRSRDEDDDDDDDDSDNDDDDDDDDDGDEDEEEKPKKKKKRSRDEERPRKKKKHRAEEEEDDEDW